MDENKEKEELNNESVTNDNNEKSKDQTTEETIIKENTSKELIVTRKKRKGSYISGTIGALLGGFVFAITWLLIYILADHMVIPVIATLIPLGAYWGYRIFKGKLGKASPVLVAIVSILLIVCVTAVICPIFLVIEAGYELNLKNFAGLFSDNRAEVRQMIIEDAVAGLVFAIIGIASVIKFLMLPKIRILTAEERKRAHEEKKTILKEQSQIIKNACLDLQSINKESPTKKKEILKQITEIYNVKRKKAKLYFINTVKNGLLKKYKGKYYYDETNEQEKIENVRKIKKRFILKKIIIIAIILLLIILSYVIYQYYDAKYNIRLAKTEIKIQVDYEKQEYYGTKEEIATKFGAEAASFCDFVLYDTAGTYEINGKAVPKSQFGNKDILTVIQEDKKEYSQVLGDDKISEILDKQFGKIAIKSYNYSYEGVDGNTYKSAIYLCETKKYYVWIGVYANNELEFVQIDEIVDNFIK